jgi:CRP-like cAMP-binding protein
MVGTGPRNRLLAALLAPDHPHPLAPVLERVRLERGAVLLDQGDEVRQLWFPEGCVVSLTVLTRDGGTAEAATVGREGAAGLVSALGDGRSVARAVVQVPGEAVRLPAEALRAAFEASPAVRRACLLHAQAQLGHVLQAAACAALHPVEARLGRWLLQVRDQAGGGAVLPLTHEFLAEMLGVQRTTVTAAALALQRAGLIDYRRGRVTVLDQAGLEGAACECHAAILAQHERLPSPGG